MEELDRLARRYGKTRSELIRHAIRRLVLEDQSGSGGQGSSTSGSGPLGTKYRDVVIRIGGED